MARGNSKLDSEKEYHKGDFVGDWGVQLLEEPYRGKEKRSCLKALVQCPYCENKYIAILKQLENGLSKSCGCARKAFRTARRRGIENPTVEDVKSIISEPKKNNYSKPIPNNLVLDKEYMEKHDKELVGPYQLELLEAYLTNRNEKGYATYRLGRFSCHENCDDCDQDFQFVSKIISVKTGKTHTCGRQIVFFDTNEGSFKFAKKDLTGFHFGKLEVLSPVEDPGSYYFTAHSKWYCRCDCGNEFITSQQSLRTSKRTKCQACVEKAISEKNRNNIELGTEFNNLIVEEYIPYSSPEHPNTYRCRCTCGNITYVTSHEISVGSRYSCGCIISKGEENIAKALKTLDVSYTRQETFARNKKYPTCRNPKTNYPLRMDFFLPDFNLCIEFDGKQHMEEQGTDYFHESLSSIQFRDSVKDEFCRVNGISLLRIPYTCRDSIDAGWLLEALRPYVGEDAYRERLALLAVGGV